MAPPDSARVDRLRLRASAIGVAAPAEACEKLLTYLDAMLVRNQQVNLTAIRDVELAEVLHALDSLAVARSGLTPQRALDLGSGNGFPGVALAAMQPYMRIDLMERTAKKSRAIGELCELAGLHNADSVCMDAQQAPRLTPDRAYAYDLVTARAVAAPAVVAKLAAPLLVRGGHLVLWLDADTEFDDDLPGGLRPLRTITYDLPEPGARRRRLGIARRG